MTVAHLIKLLQQQPQDYEILINVASSTDDSQVLIPVETSVQQIETDPMNGFVYINVVEQIRDV
jgi:hypothetical protein